MTVGEFARRTGAQLMDVDPETSFYQFALDSREAGAGSLFLAIKGARVDGTSFAIEAIENGAVTAVVEEPVAAPCIVVDNLVDALARLASSFRDEFHGPVVGVTGSVGKTTTKELIAAALSPLGKIAKTEGNRNTEYTAPLLWAELKPSAAAVVVEMSMRGFGQIAHLARFSRPTVGVITNIGSSHAEMVGSRQGVAEAKLELFDALEPSGLSVFWAEDDFAELLRQRAKGDCATFGFSTGADARVVSVRPLSWDRSRVQVDVDGRLVEFDAPGIGVHFGLNCAAALLVAKRLGANLEDAAAAIAAMPPLPMRMEIQEIDGVTFVLDMYNAAPQSFVAALEAFQAAPCAGKRVVVAGEMRELGAEHEPGHEAVGRAVAATTPDLTMFYGPAMAIARDAALACGATPENLLIMPSLEAIAERLKALRPGDAVLIKGSRALELERVVEALRSKSGSAT